MSDPIKRWRDHSPEEKYAYRANQDAIRAQSNLDLQKADILEARIAQCRQQFECAIASAEVLFREAGFSGHSECMRDACSELIDHERSGNAPLGEIAMEAELW